MQTEKPSIPKVVVTALDRKTGKSKSATIYDATPTQVIDALKSLGKPRRKQQASAA